MEDRSTVNIETKKRTKLTDREYNTARWMLMCKQLGFTLRELLDMEHGEIVDLMIESANDHAKYNTVADQEDFDGFNTMF